MACSICGCMAVETDYSRPSEKVHLAPKGGKTLTGGGTWLHPCIEVELCSYHRRKAKGLFDTDPNYWKSQVEDPCSWLSRENLLKRHRY